MREELLQDLQEYLSAKYECGRISANEIGVVVGSYDDNGFVNDTTCVVKITAKPFYFKEATDTSKEINAFDLQSEIENYMNGTEV